MNPAANGVTLKWKDNWGLRTLIRQTARGFHVSFKHDRAHKFIQITPSVRHIRDQFVKLNRSLPGNN